MRRGGFITLMQAKIPANPPLVALLVTHLWPIYGREFESKKPEAHGRIIPDNRLANFAIDKEQRHGNDSETIDITNTA